MTIPSLTQEQMQKAREAATAARRVRAELKSQIKEGKLTFTKALDKAIGDEILAHIKVIDLLKAMPRVGEKRATEIIERLGIAPNRRVRGLGRHQVALLKAEFE